MKRLISGLTIVLICLIPLGSVRAMQNHHVFIPNSFSIEMKTWEQVNTFIPKNSIFTILDFETGKSFKVQRRAGRNHADVQPLTTHDTKIMKSIYGGKWSWKRRAIIVIVDDQMLAASMHGMPHGAGALKNNFPGHFCVHFAGSITHKTKSADPSHKMMILKSAGKLEEYINSVDPYELIEIFTVGVNQKDEKIRNLTLIPQKKMIKLVHTKLKKYDGLVIKHMALLPTEDSDGLLELTIPVEVDIYKIGEKKKKKEIIFTVIREALTDSWKIDGSSFLEQLD
ncbi:hypothetical protein LCL95_04350 [Bacillus timonensis]|nr:hypothetical protein [Bacillus timonensis]